jgi:cyclin-dependent kinase regulatory subunit CKS1
LCRPEPHILLFRRELGTDPVTGRVNPVLREQAVTAYNREYAEKK